MHTHDPPLSFYLSPTNRITHTLFLPFSLSLSLFPAHAHTHTHARTHTHTHTYTHTQCSALPSLLSFTPGLPAPAVGAKRIGISLKANPLLPILFCSCF